MRQNRSRLSRSPAELRARAAEFQEMAKDARPMQVIGALLRIADRYQALADERERMQEECERVEKGGGDTSRGVTEILRPRAVAETDRSTKDRS